MSEEGFVFEGNRIIDSDGLVTHQDGTPLGVGADPIPVRPNPFDRKRDLLGFSRVENWLSHQPWWRRRGPLRWSRVEIDERYE